MPTYVTKCSSCGGGGDMRLSFTDYDLIKSGESNIVCNQCEGDVQILFDPSTVQFVLKDGPISGGWASKSLKENKYRATRREHMARRERDHVFKPRLQPNFKGIETGTWKEAKEFARTEVAKDHGAELGNLAAKTFEPMVRKESKKT